MNRVLIVFMMCFCLVGCGHKVEMSNIGLVAGFGIDKTDTGYLMTAQVVNPSSVAGNHQDTLPIITIQAEGSTLFEAYRRLSNLTSKVLYLPHLNVIVIDEKIAKDGIRDILDFTLRNVEIRPNITLMVAKDVMAADILSTLSPNESIPINQLNSLGNMCHKCTGRQVSYNLYDAINMVNAKGVELVLNSVELKTNNPDLGEDVSNILQSDSPTQFEVNYLAAFRQDQFVGYINSQEAELYNALMNNVSRYVINTNVGDEYYITFEGRQTKVDIKPQIDANKFLVNYEVSGVIMQNQYPIDLTVPENITTMETYIQADLKQQLEDFILKTQTELKSDLIGVGSKIYMKDPKQWKQLQGYWSDIYPNLSFEVAVKVKVSSVGDIQNLQRQ